MSYKSLVQSITCNKTYTVLIVERELIEKDIERNTVTGRKD